MTTSVEAARRGARWIALLLALACSVAGCRPRGGGLAPVPERGGIVSLVPSATEMLFAIGAGDQVVGRSLHCDYPAQVSALPSVGSGLEPDVERIVVMAPAHVVITEAQRELPAVGALRAAGIDVVEVPDVALDDVPAALRRLGALAGRVPEAEAEASTFESRIDAVEAAVAGHGAPSALIVVAVDPIFAAGPESRLGELLAVAGGRNVLSDGDWVGIDDELVATGSPEVIIDSSGGDVARWQRLATVPAVRNGRVCVVDADLLARPGPRLAEGAAAMARCLHPDVALADPGPGALATGTQDTHAGPRDTLRLASWNIAWLRAGEAFGRNGRGDGDGVRSPADLERLRVYAQRLDADVVVLQEVEGPEAARHVFPASEWDVHFADEDDLQRVGVVWRRGLDVRPQPDLAALDVGDLRRGVDVAIHFEGQQIRVLGIHLKSGCFTQDWTTSQDNDCPKFGRQVPVVEQWIEERFAEGVAFAVAGDFNRRLGPGDEMWNELDDRNPRALDLVLTTEGLRQQCWDSRYPDYIDHIVLDGRAAAWMVERSFAELVYDEPAELRDVLSDHCPISVVLDPAR